MRALSTSILAVAIVAFPVAARAGDDPACVVAVERYSAESGLPKSLGHAIASGTRPRGGMSPFLVRMGSHVRVARSAAEARALANDAFRRGAESVDVGCLAVTVARGDERALEAALDPDRNVAASIGATVTRPGARKVARAEAAAAPSYQPSVTPSPRPVTPAEPARAGPGGVAGSWGLFTDAPVTNPFGGSR